MSALKQKLARIGARAGLLAGASAAVLAISGIGASSALAEGVCTGANIEGQGASLQGVAQSLWSSTLKEGVGFNSNALGCPTEGKKPMVTYTASGSGAGLKAWGVNGGVLNEADAFAASDDAPNDEQLTEMNTALEAHAAGADVAVIPVIQTSIAVIVNLPEDCTLTRIRNAELEGAFRGSIKKWSEINGANGTGCSTEITRVVRLDGSGTTYQFKHYLLTNHEASVLCTTEYGEVGKSWAFLQNNTEVEGHIPNTTWPDCAGTTPIKRGAKNGNGPLVQRVNETDSSIGYSAISDVEANKTAATTVLNVQDFFSGGTYEYAPPLSGKNANCSNVPYKNKPRKFGGGAEVSSWEEAGTLYNLNWSAVYGSDKNVGNKKYPICTLTFDFSTNKETAIFGAPAKTTVSDYFTYVVAPKGGQADASENYYSPLPNFAGNEVQLAAEKSLGLIK